MNDQTQTELALNALNTILAPYITAGQQSDIRTELASPAMAAKVIAMAQRIEECPNLSEMAERRGERIAFLRYVLEGLDISFYITAIDKDGATGCEGVWTAGLVGVLGVGCRARGSSLPAMLEHGASLDLDFPPTATRHLKARFNDLFLPVQRISGLAV